MDRQTLKERFPLGSRVLVSSTRSLEYGKEGVVASYCGTFIGVDFGDTFSGHNLNGEIMYNTGWYCIPESLRLVDQPPEIEPEIGWNMVFE